MTEKNKDSEGLIFDYSQDVRAGFIVENMLPGSVFTPNNSFEIMDFVRQSNNDNLSIIPFGGGTRKNFGMPPIRYDTALDMSELNAVINHNPDDLTISVQAGITLDSLQAVLLEHGQFLPISAPLSHLTTIGGILASDSNGPIKWRYGHFRDLVIGMKFFNSEGSIIKTGGNVVKNVTGYDTAKLHIGALGTLGIISEVSMRLMPKPRVNNTVVAQFGNMKLATSVSKAIFHSSVMPLALSIFTGNVANRLGVSANTENVFLAVNIVGGPDSVERQQKELLQFCFAGDSNDFKILTFLETGSFWQKLTDFGWEDSSPSLSIVRVSTDFSKIDKLMNYLFKIQFEDRLNIELILNPGYGTIDIHWIGQTSQIDLEKFTKSFKETIRFLRSQSERVIIESCPSSIKREINVWGEIPDGFPLMRSIKEQYDPNVIFNPGRFVDGI
ncbi:MAG: hypothetical protein CL735_05070 [Chloroflexi bacterium]|nr:hypothetical protein [Chloroflexota bacterium]